jgi:hypothetical protein
MTLTRWHFDDLAGRAEALAASGRGKPWTILRLPALAELAIPVPGVLALGRGVGVLAVLDRVVDQEQVRALAGRDIIFSREYQNVFPGITIRSDNRAAEEWELEQGSRRPCGP